MNPAQPPALNFDQDTMQRFQAAKAAGVPDDVNYQHASQYQASKMQQAQPTQQGNWLTDLLPAIGGTAGALIGTPLGPLGSIGGGAVGSGAGEFAKELFTHQQPNVGNIAKEAATGGIGGVFGEGLSGLADRFLPKLFPAAADAATSLSENLGIKGLRLKPSQLTAFQDAHGMDLGKYLTGNNYTGQSLVGRDSEYLMNNVAKPLQEQFDAIKSSNLAVPSQTLIDNFQKQIDVLRQSPVTEDIRVADQLGQELANMVAREGPDHTIPISDLVKFRQAYDNRVGNWASDPLIAGKNRLAGTTLRNTIQQAADQAGLTGPNGMGLKDMGIELSKLYDLTDAAQMQSNLGRGSLPIGLSNLLGGVTGSGIGGFPGAVAGMATTNILNNPATSRLASRGLGGISDLLSKFQGIPEVIPQAGGQAIAQSQTPGKANAQEAEIIPAGNDTADLTNVAQNTLPANTNSAPTDPLRLILGEAMLRRSRTPQEMASAYQFLNPRGYAQSLPLNSQQQQEKILADDGLRSLQTVAQTLSTNKAAPLLSNLPFAPGARTYKAALTNMLNNFIYLKTGKQASDQERNSFQALLPQVGDSPADTLYKLKTFSNFFNQVSSAQIPANSSSGDILTPSQ